MLVWWTAFSFYLVWSVFKEKELTLVILFKKKKKLACVWKFDLSTSFKLFVIIDSLVLCSLIPIWLTLAFIQGHNCLKKKKAVYFFSESFQSVFMKFCVATVSAEYVSCDQCKRKRSYLGGFVRNTFKTGLLSDAFKSVSFRFGLMLDSAILYSFIPVWITLIFI